MPQTRAGRRVGPVAAGPLPLRRRACAGRRRDSLARRVPSRAAAPTTSRRRGIMKIKFKFIFCSESRTAVGARVNVIPVARAPRLLRGPALPP